MLHAKKEYVKATVTCQELMTQAFIAASGEIIIPPTYINLVEAPQCTSQAAMHTGQYSIAKNLPNNTGSWFKTNPENSCPSSWPALGFTNGEDAYIYHQFCNGKELWYVSHSVFTPECEN